MEDGSFRKIIAEAFGEKEVDVRTYSPLALAFLGDAVYSLAARTAVVSKGSRSARKLHDETRDLVSAGAQAALGDAIQALLSEEEAKVYKRGLNANPTHHAKNATWEVYRKATALETLAGYLYLTDRMDRFTELLKRGLDAVSGTAGK